ncbi:hypothetical protein GYH30_006812 [Glycine max]|nr:hypothetical protein GYH30_006812 [Glycine max]
MKATGEDYSMEPAESRRPFCALLDVGLIRTTTGNHVFGALKGALDGGLDIPHSDKRFVGFYKEKKELDAEVHRKYAFGGHVAAYMKAREKILFCINLLCCLMRFFSLLLTTLFYIFYRSWRKMNHRNTSYTSVNTSSVG